MRHTALLAAMALLAACAGPAVQPGATPTAAAIPAAATPPASPAPAATTAAPIVATPSPSPIPSSSPSPSPTPTPAIAATASPSRTPLVTTAIATLAPTIPPTVAPLRTPAPTIAPTPAPSPTCAPTGGDPARTGIAGTVGYGGPAVVVPVGGVRVEGREGTTQGRVLGSAVSGADGRFRILGLTAGTPVAVWVPEGDYRTAGSFPPASLCADQVVEMIFGLLVDRYLTGINYQHGSTVAARATIRWDPAADITSYCVELSVEGVAISQTAAQLGATGSCPGFNPGWPIGAATSFTLPSGASGTTIRFVVRGYHTKVSLPVAYLRGGLPASFEGMHVFAVQ